ncbi:hypothetical protein [Haloarcula nitratireducens]|uniref:PRC-barrel domain-containing protein n=1 Tax=Haloarcula nitratireducens TaxID=2487749 RepID=A0AAW4PF66_9EURY|nr:hypothetical protein [Halomicroarcula nitratireducens]MBX0296253.1 hypothetical protein [Halomicroarcula nitratireducens]
MVRNFRSEDEGKHVMTADGDMVGTIERASGGTAHVKPDSGLSGSIRRKLGWTDESEETYSLEKANVDKINDDGIHLKSNF